MKDFTVPTEKLCWKCDKDTFAFDVALFCAETFFGQERATTALTYGLQSGSNMYINQQGEEFVTDLVKICREKAKEKDVFDWVHVHDFENPGKPKAKALPLGQGKKFKEGMDSFYDFLLTSFASEFNKAFEPEEKKVRDEFESFCASCTQGEVPPAEAVLEAIREEEAKAKKRLEEVKNFYARLTVENQLGYLRTEIPSLYAYFNDMVNDFASHVDRLLYPGQSIDFVKAYKVNLFVEGEERPVIFERNPTYANMFGSVEHVFLPGGIPATDLTMIKPGSLHRANGGVLILNVYDVLTAAHSWTYLVRALQAKEIKLHDVMEPFRTTHFVIPSPAGVPLDVTIILVGQDHLFSLLLEKEPEFKKLFPVNVVFDRQIENNEKNRIDASLSLGLSPGETAELINYAVKGAGTKEKINLAALHALLPEVKFLGNVKKAIEAKEKRNGKVKNEIEKRMLENTTLIQTEGFTVGQVNALAVASVSGASFGTILRVTANTYSGKGEVVNIEREVKNSGGSYDKGVFILTSYLKARFGKTKPLSLGVSICMEQHMGGIDGDSASSTELYALLSSMSEIGINQGIAVTGSVNQKGEVQAIGGVNQKIEGFFDLCNARGLTGKQGVMIPAANVKDLVLKDEVVSAVKFGLFEIFAVNTIDEGFEILTGRNKSFTDEAVKANEPKEEEE